MTNYSNYINGLYIVLYGRTADSGGYNYWLNTQGVAPAAAAVTPISAASEQALSKAFVSTQSSYFDATYGLTSSSGAALSDTNFILALYNNLGGNDTGVSGAALAYWQNALNALHGDRAALAGRFTEEFLSYNGTDPAGLVRQAAFLNSVAVSQAWVSASASNSFMDAATTTDAAFHAQQAILIGITADPATLATALGQITTAVSSQSLTGVIGQGGAFELTVAQDTFVGHGSNETFNAPLNGPFGNQNTLTSFDNLSDTGSNNVLNASFDGSNGGIPGLKGSHDVHVSGVNITGIQTWNIQNIDNSYNRSGSSVYITGDASTGNVIRGIQTLNYNANSGTASLYIGNNTQPVQETAGAFGGSNTGFNLNVSNAVGTGSNGVDVDFAAAIFTGNGDTINVGASIVGGFPLDSGGTILIPPHILGTTQDPDNYAPNWVGFGENAFAIAAGASSGPNGPVGFQIWNVNSNSATAVGTQNILALGGEGSKSATTINLADDGSDTILYSTRISDSNSSDWTNVANIGLSATSGYVVLTGAETEAAFGSNSYSFGGLLTSDTTALKSIVGGQGNSFYDLTSLTDATAHGATIDGGHSANGNSEVAFNNSVVAGSLSVTLTNISVLDSASNSQGGTINMFNFAGLETTNVPFVLLQGGQVGGLTLESETGTTIGTVVTPESQVLQLLNAAGGTATALTQNLFIENATVDFAVNMGDVANAGHNITIDAIVPSTLVNFADTLQLFVSDKGVTVTVDRAPQESISMVGPVTAFIAPVVTIDNYTTTDIFLPNEDGNFVVLGSTKFVDQPVVTVTNASLNFYDNTADNGGSPEFSGADNLVLGHTQFTQDAILAPSVTVPGALTLYDIGHTTVQIDATSGFTTINDFGGGHFEIGATNATNLNAQNTSGLTQDISATLSYVVTGGIPSASGITVVGSASAENLLQGTSGDVYLDPITNGTHGSGVVVSTHVGNDNLTGSGNIFAEGGNDVVNLGGLQSTVWVGEYDVGHSGGLKGVGVGNTFGQAITDIVGGVETYVDGYGPGYGLTVNGFALSNDTVTFNAGDWARGLLNSGATKGLVDNFGNALTGVTTGAAGASINNVAAPGILSFPLHQADLTLDTIGTYANDSQLVTALKANNVGDITFGGSLAAHSVEHVLLAYSTGADTRIVDLTLTNTSGSSIGGLLGFNTSNSNVQVAATDLVDLVGVNINVLTSHNVSLVA